MANKSNVGIAVDSTGPTCGSVFRLMAISTLVACLASCGKQEIKVPEPRPVSAVKVSVGPISDEVAYSGEVRARHETNLGFRVAGKIVARNVEVGSVVRKGDLLARLDREDQNLNVQGAQSQLAAARSEHDQLKAELERYTDLYKKEFISRAEYDRRVSQFDVAKARLAQAQSQLSVSENQTGYTALVADHEGVITGLLAEVGQVVAAGQTVIKLARTREKEVVINVPENRLSELSATREISITLWADPEKRYHGRVRELSPSADPVTRTYAAKVTVLDADVAVKLGMTANVYLEGIQRGAAVLLPATVLFQENGRASVWVVDPAGGTVKPVPVEVGEYTDDKVAILSGLSQGDIVVRAGVHKLFSGEKVRTDQPDGTAPALAHNGAPGEAAK